MQSQFTAFVEYDPETAMYVGTIPAIPGAHSQGVSLDELQANLREVVELCMEELKASGEALPEDAFVGIQRVAVNL